MDKIITTKKWGKHQMKMRKLLAGFLTVSMVLTFLPAAAFAAAEPQAGGPWDLTSPDPYTVTIDGAQMNLEHYRVTYAADPVPVYEGGNITDKYQSMHIYIPPTATETSPIIFLVSNSGWRPTSADSAQIMISDGATMNTAAESVAGAEATALKAGYVLVAVGTRSRSLQDENGEYVGHAPSVVVDAKAGIRYLRYNDDAMLGSADRIVITGTSGGGGLSTIVAASGNSEDYLPDLYDIGAAGVTRAGDAGNYTYASTINDDVFATVAYCPITDLDHADQAYEWQYNTTRTALAADSLPAYTYLENPLDTPNLFTSNDLMTASDALKAAYPAYVDSLGLKLEDGTPLTASNLEGAITALVEKEIDAALIAKGSVDDLRAEITGNPYGDDNWLAFVDGKAKIDYEDYLYFVARNTELKGAPAFDNMGSALVNTNYKESDLFGTKDEEYKNFEFWSWNNNYTAGDGSGLDDTGDDWDAYIATDAGKAVLQQAKMINPIPYLTSGTEGDSAPYWYVRHGMMDRDTSFALETTLNYAIQNANDVKETNFKFTWLRGHQGNYDTPEAFAWIAKVVAEADAVADTVAVTGVSLKPSSKTIAVGKTTTLTATIVPANASNTAVTWKSNKNDIAVVSPDGTVTAKKAGNTTITVTTADGGKTANAAITVTQPVTGVKLNVAAKTLKKGKTYTFKATVSPKNASNKALTWKSTKPSVAKVNNKGVVTAKKNGDTTISATTKDGNKKASAKLKVGGTAVKSVKLDKSRTTIKKNKSRTLKATVKPAAASFKGVTWSSSKKDVAKVNSKGKVTGVSKGQANITVKTKDGNKKAVCKVTVN